MTNSLFKYRFLLLAIFFLFADPTFSQTIDKSDAVIFDVNNAYTQLSITTNALASEKLSISNLTSLSQNLKENRTKAKQCIEAAEDGLMTINKLIESFQVLSGQELVQKSEEYKYLQEKKEDFIKQALSCRLFLFKSDEPTKLLNKSIKQQSTYTILRPSTPIWKIFSKEVFLQYKNIDFKKCYQLWKLDKITTIQWVYCAALLSLFLIMAFGLFFLSRYILKTPIDKKSTLYPILSSTKLFCFPVLLSGALSIFFYIIFFNEVTIPTPALFSYLFFAYFLFVATVHFLVGFQKTIISETESLKQYYSLFVRMILLGTLLATGLLVASFFRFQDLSQSLTDITLTIFYIPLTFVLIWTSWVFSKLPDLKKTTVLVIKLVLLSILIFITLTTLLGFYQLSSYLILSVLFTLFLSWVVIFLLYLISKLDHTFNDKDQPLAQKIHFYLGIKLNHKITGLLFIKIALYALILYSYLHYLMLSWRVSLNTIDKIKGFVFEGFKIANLHIIPLNITYALLSFGILLIIGKWLSSIITRHYQFYEGKKTQVPIGVIAGYINFGIALIFSLLIAGVGFTSLLVIVGAISVGVGLGLQIIIGNFFSGILLLLSDDIRPGDLVRFDSIEGVIKKIRLRTTHITTLTNEDIIVPNIDFITNRITNLTYLSDFSQIVKWITVEWGDDIEITKEILLNIAKRHPEIIQKEPNQPKVLFAKYDKDNMVFLLLYAVQNVKNKNIIDSDLNFAIAKEFKVISN